MRTIGALRVTLLTGAALICMASPAQAQAPASATPASPQVSTEGAVAAPAASDARTSDIIVTAQRRSERLRDVPISITALSSEVLSKSGVENTMDLQRVTPGLQLQLYGGFLQPSIRGINSAGAGLDDSSNVAVYVDGIYQPSESGQLQDLPDVQNIQVLKGPQGTFYGQNAEGGAIIINTIAPSFTPAGKLSASYGNYDDKSVRGYLTGPITSTLAAEIGAGYEDRGGFVRDILRGGHSNGLQSRLVRGKLLWQPSTAVSFTLGAYYSRRADGDIFANQPLNGDALGYALAPIYGLTLPKPTQPHEFAHNELPENIFTSYGFNLRGEFKLGFGTISTVTAYGNVKVRDHGDVDGTAASIGTVATSVDHHDFIQELNYSSGHIGRLTVSAGLFYMNKEESYPPQIFNSQYNKAVLLTAYPTVPTTYFILGSYSRGTNHSYAAYLEATYDITDRLILSAGGRYDYERERNQNFVIQAPPPLALPPSPLPSDPRNPFTFKKFTPRATLRYKLNDMSNVYFSYSQGFKSGFANSLDFVSPPVKPESLTAYEVGYKGRLSDMLSLNIAAYHYDYSNLQVFIYVPPNGYYQNAATARVNGVDFDTSLKISRNLSATLGVAYVDAKYRSFPKAGIYVPNAFGFGNDQMSPSASGNQLTRAPKLTGNAAINYGVDTGAGRLGAYVSGNYNSGLYYDPNNRVHQPRYATLAAELSFMPDALKGLRAVVYGKNLTNHNYLSSVLESQLGDLVSYAEPRTYGVRIEYAF
jgi:iron complex outermembrane receptor protein